MASSPDLKSRIARVLNSRTHSLRFRHIAAIFALLALAFAAIAPIRAEEIYKVGGDVTAPRVLDRVEPQYTEEARHSRISGTVVLSVVIRPDGMAHDIIVAKSLDPGLDRTAAEAVEQWHFAPATRNGETVSVEAVIEVNFRLK